MKTFTVIAVAALIYPFSCEGIPFHPRSLFGVGRGGGARDLAVAPSEGDDYERAEKAISDAIARVERKVQNAIEMEVDTLFHEHEGTHKADVAIKAQTAVQQGVHTVKRTMDHHAERHVYPFENDQPFPYAFPKRSDDADHREQRILHAVESAEKAVLHAIQAEVDTLFHAVEHHEDGQGSAKVAHDKVRIGVQNASDNVKDMQNHRRKWLDRTAALIDDYTAHEYFLE